MTFRGTLAEINAALDGLVFHADRGFNGPATVSVTINDLGNSGSGGARSDTDIDQYQRRQRQRRSNSDAYRWQSGLYRKRSRDGDRQRRHSDRSGLRRLRRRELSVFFSAGGTDDDRLAIRDQGTATGEIGISGSNVTYNFGAGVVLIGNFAGGTDGVTPLIVTLNANATASAVQALMRNITYQNLSDNPSIFSRTMQFALTDGDGGSSNVASRDINLTAVNDAPTATNLNAAETYTEDTPLNLTDIVVSDVDSANVTATLTLSDAAAGSLNTGTSGAVTSTYNAGDRRVDGLRRDRRRQCAAGRTDVYAGAQLTTADFYDRHQCRATAWRRRSPAPRHDRHRGQRCADGDQSQSTAETYTEDTPLNLTDIVVSDVDSANVTATLTLSEPGRRQPQHGTSGAVTSTYNAGTGVWTASGAIADVNTLLAG